MAFGATNVWTSGQLREGKQKIAVLEVDPRILQHIGAAAYRRKIAQCFRNYPASSVEEGIREACAFVDTEIWKTINLAQELPEKPDTLPTVGDEKLWRLDQRGFSARVRYRIEPA